MKHKLKYIIVMLLVAASQLCYGQYFQGLYDADSSQEWGYDIHLQPDGNYLVFGMQINTTTSHVWKLFNLEISSDGSSIMSKHILECSSANYFIGIYGEVKKLQTGTGYVAPFTVEKTYGGNARGWGGILKYNNAGDTTFLKTYTDTSIYYDAFNSLAIMPDGGYIIGGAHDFDTPSYYPAYLIRTDSFGDSLWTHTYQKYTNQEAGVINVIAQNDGKIVVGAMSTYQEFISGFGNISHNTPWFLLLDSLGSILKDTLYGSEYMVGYNSSELFGDMNGGYIYIGIYDSLFTLDPTNAINFPCYIAHIDTNFHITWITEFPYTADQGHRQGVLMRQLHDSSYVLLGDDWSDSSAYNKGFAAKISRTGEIIWSHTYYNEAKQDAYFRDMAEKPDGSLIFTGVTFNDTIPSWHQYRDMWLIGVDSNGCEIPGCNVTGIKNIIKHNQQSYIVYPNPSSNELTIEHAADCDVRIFNLLGQEVFSYKVNSRL